MVQLGCNADLHQIRACEGINGGDLPPCASKDCDWGMWADWSDCSCPCGGGQRTRDRHIFQAPMKGGKPCQAQTKEQIAPCNTAPCDQGCTDGAWGNWMAWEPCSASCKGVTWRGRKVAVEANSCGVPVSGPSHETASCNMDVECFPHVDCEFGIWSDWSGCTKPCDGLKRRSRVIAVQGRGHGTPCEGSLKEVHPCNPDVNQLALPECKEKPKLDCEVATWGLWEPCSHECGGGTTMRTRQVLQEPDNGGQGCTDDLSMVKPCNTVKCNTECTPVDCTWGAWSYWGTCDKCGGQKSRYRHVSEHARCGGQACSRGDSEQVEKCPRKCHDARYCTWEDWGSWGGCDAKCGQGSRTRVRNLQIVTKERFLEDISQLDEMTMETKLQSLLQRNRDLETNHFQQIVVAFAAGGVSLVAMLVVVRFGSVATSSRRQLEVERQPQVE